MGICGWICITIMFIVACFTVDSMFDSYIYLKSENLENNEKEKDDEEKEN